MLHPESFKAGLKALSKQRVEDTLIAEAGGQSELIERLRKGKAEHNNQSLSSLLGLSGKELQNATKFLRDIGCLEVFGASYKVPMLYRDGLNITQGKAFDPGAPPQEEDEEN